MGKRENGTGTIRTIKGANGTRYYAYAPERYTVAEDGSVRRSRQALGAFTRKADAKAALEEFRQHPTAQYRATLEDVYKAWSSTAYRDISKSTADNYRAAWSQASRARPDLITRAMREITTSDIRSILDYWTASHEVDGKRVGPLSKSSITKIKAVFTQLFSYAAANDIVSKDYAALVKLPKDMEDGGGRALTEAEFQLVRKAVGKIPGADVILALCYLGFRISEFLQLTPADYDRQAHTLRGGLKTKAGKNRLVPVHPAIRPMVEAWADRGCGTLYARPDGRPYNADSFRRLIWVPATKAMGLPPDLTPHSCRHTAATRLSAAGARPEDIKKILGHADFAVTADVYINQDAETLEKAMALVE